MRVTDLYYCCFQAVLQNWQSTTIGHVWLLDITNKPFLWFAFVVFHLICWSLILGALLLLDPYELLGIRQVSDS